MEERKKNKYTGPVIIAALIAVIFAASGIYYYFHTIIHDGKPVDIRATDWAYEIESAEIRDDAMVIRGWCFKETEDTKQSMSGLRLILEDTSAGSGKIYIPAEYGILRPEVAAYFCEGYDYSYCGFEASVPLTKIDPDNTTYEIILQQDQWDSDVVRTGEYLCRGEILPYDPDRFAAPDTEGTDLAEITEKGILRAVVPEYGIYIYQKDWKLYLLLDDNNAAGMEAYRFGYYDYFALSVRNTMDEYDYTIDDRSSYWTLQEITATMNAGHYHVIERDIPEDFPVAWIEIGIYGPEGLLSYPRFFPQYRFAQSESGIGNIS